MGNKIALLASCNSGKIAKSNFTLVFQQLSGDYHSNLPSAFCRIFSCREKTEHDSLLYLDKIYFTPQNQD